ncbi:PhnD/SsuA/transferrin family substrate-binding protein [Prosthecobacter sp.]|uniref:PhnD/SsuA/transferrin family substrate-binding protein n=1 Tax=Prosthecobacter sp. TaxID=1965333 RepID=UPI0037839BE3
MKLRLTQLALAACLLAASAAQAETISMLVMDPLSKDLACDCVKGYAQRNYRALAAHLQQKTGIEITVTHAEKIATALKEMKGAPGIIIGKKSVVLSEAAKNKLEFTPVARLTGKDGSASQQGLIVVRRDSPVKTLADLKGARILFGPEDCEEKSAAAIALLKEAGVAVPEKLETSPSCSTAAEALMKLPAGENAAAVISSYAEPLLSGCGTIKQGDLRIVATTKDVPFITAFASSGLSKEQIKAITEALLDTGGDPELLKVMESVLGFIDMTEPDGKVVPKPVGWHQFRGPNRDGVAPWLPAALPEKMVPAWQVEVPADGVGGIAATEREVILGARDSLDGADVFFCLEAASGLERWRFEYPATAREPLDYGNSPRATPLISEGRVFLLGAFGHLNCVDLASGELVWTRHLPPEFEAALPKWGCTGSPLLHEGRLIVQPGGREASLIALDPKTGDVLWESPGRRASYAGFIAAIVHGKAQLVGYDEETLGGWDAATGKRLWEHKPEQKGDFNVPTPFMIGQRLCVFSENNGTRLFEFDAAGRLIDTPVAHYEDLAPDAHSPVRVGARIVGCSQQLQCLDAQTLKPLWNLEDRDFGTYASIISDGLGRTLTLSDKGCLMLHDVNGPKAKKLGHLHVCESNIHVLSHPAIVGNRLYLRLGQQVVCMLL